MAKLRVGICGFGGLGHVHARSLAGMEDVEIASVCDIDPAKLAPPVSRRINGEVQRYEYDLRGQLTGVYDGDGSAPSEARRFLRGASPRRVRTSHPLVPSVGTMEEESNPNEVV